MGWSVTKVEPVTHDSESHLEQRFRKLFTERLTDLGATLKETPGPWGNTLSITFPNATRQWMLEPQVPMGSVRPDFVLRSSQHTLPLVAIFTDGWRFHAVPACNRIADDAQKRRMLRDQGAMVLSLTWRDLEQALTRTVATPQWFDQQLVALLMQKSPDFGPDHVELLKRGPIDFLLGWIQHPDLAGHEALGNQAPWLFARGGTQLALDPGEDLARAALEQLIEPGTPSPARAITNAWWWGAGDVGVLTRASVVAGRPSLETVVLLDDRPGRLTEAHRPAWEEWLRIGNVLGLRTQPGQILAVSEVLTGAVASPEAPATRAPAGLPPQWLALVDLASDEERGLLVDLAAGGSVPVPELGHETDAGVPLDVAWPDARVAVDLNVDPDTRRELLDAGWTLVPADAHAVVVAVTAALKEI